MKSYTTSAVAGAILLAFTAMLAGQDNAAKAPAGDAAKGKALFESVGCMNCHRVGDKGSHTGPNLSDIGDRRTPDRLQRSITAPNDEVLPENRFVKVVLKDGSNVTGRLLNHDAISVQMIDTKQELRSLDGQNSRLHDPGERSDASADQTLRPGC